MKCFIPNSLYEYGREVELRVYRKTRERVFRIDFPEYVFLFCCYRRHYTVLHASPSFFNRRTSPRNSPTGYRRNFHAALFAESRDYRFRSSFLFFPFRCRECSEETERRTTVTAETVKSPGRSRSLSFAERSTRLVLWKVSRSTRTARYRFAPSSPFPINDTPCPIVRTNSFAASSNSFLLTNLAGDCRPKDICFEYGRTTVKSRRNSRTGRKPGGSLPVVLKQRQRFAINEHLTLSWLGDEQLRRTSAIFQVIFHPDDEKNHEFSNIALTVVGST